MSLGLRALVRRPLASAAAILTLALGIGLNAAVYSVVDWVLVRPLPYPAAHELVRVFTAGTAPVTGPGAFAYSEFAALANASTLHAAVGFSTATRVIAGSGLEPSHAVVSRVGGDLFATLGVTAESGRVFGPDEIAGGAPVIVISHTVWRTRLNGDPQAAGRMVTIDGAPHTVVGVMPAGRGYPPDADVWRPLTSDEREDDDRELNVVGRLRSGTTAAAASAELAAIVSASSGGARTAWADDMQRTDVREVRAALNLLMASAALILLIACANVAALVGTRAADRAAEMAVRGALGASRSRLLRLLLSEALLLAAVGGAAGLVLGQWTLDALVAAAPSGLPRIAEITLDARIMGFGLAATLLAGLAVAMAPAVRSSQTGEAGALHGAGPARVTRRSAVRRGLVMAQVAMAVVLTAGAGLLGRSLENLIAINHGFAVDRLVSVDLYLRGAVTGDAQPLFQTLIAQAQTVPGVESAAVAMRLPTETTGLRAPIAIAGRTAPATPATLRPISGGYFATAGIRVLEGRVFTSADGDRAPRVGIVNASLAREAFGGRPVLGTRVTMPLADDPITIVGVVADVTPAGEGDRPALYVPIDQLRIGSGYLLVRASGDARSIAVALAQRVRDVAPGLAVDRVARVAQALEDSRSATRFTTQLVAVFAALALLLAGIGIYGLVAGEVAARWREMAVRMALGAAPRAALWTIVRPCAILFGAGAIAGIGGALAAGPWLASLLYGIDPADPPTLLLAPTVLGLVGALAAVLAAAPVVRADPAATLRRE
jgi:predicted permease